MSYDGQTIFSAHNSQPEMTPGAFAAMLDRVRAIREQDDARVRELCERFKPQERLALDDWRQILEGLARSGYAIFPVSDVDGKIRVRYSP